MAPFVETQGPDNTPGSLRTARVPFGAGVVYNFTEEVTCYLFLSIFFSIIKHRSQ